VAPERREDFARRAELLAGIQEVTTNPFVLLDADRFGRAALGHTASSPALGEGRASYGEFAWLAGRWQ
jgi:hypothetical protein